MLIKDSTQQDQEIIYKYVPKNKTTQIYIGNTIMYKGRDILQHSSGGWLQHLTLINGQVIQTEKQYTCIRAETYH